MIAESHAREPDEPDADRAGTHRAPLIRKAAVLGAGTMGSRIAAHLANAGLPVVLLDHCVRRARRAAPSPMQALGSAQEIQARGLFRPVACRAHHHRQFRGRPGAAAPIATG